MGNYEELKAAVASVIKTNGNQEITGQVLQNTLTTLISQVGANATFAGIATPNTAPGTPDQNVFYIAGQSGVYANFGGYEVINEAVIFNNISGSWTATKMGAQAVNGVNVMEFLAADSDLTGYPNGAIMDFILEPTANIKAGTDYYIKYLYNQISSPRFLLQVVNNENNVIAQKFLETSNLSGIQWITINNKANDLPFAKAYINPALFTANQTNFGQKLHIKTTNVNFESLTPAYMIPGGTMSIDFDNTNNVTIVIPASTRIFQLNYVYITTAVATITQTLNAPMLLVWNKATLAFSLIPLSNAGNNDYRNIVVLGEINGYGQRQLVNSSKYYVNGLEQTFTTPPTAPYSLANNNAFASQKMTQILANIGKVFRKEIDLTNTFPFWAIRDIQVIECPDTSILYRDGVLKDLYIVYLRKKGNNTSSTIIQIGEKVGDVVGVNQNLLAQIQTSADPAATIETLTLTGTGIKIALTIEWTNIANNASYSLTTQCPIYAPKLLADAMALQTNISPMDIYNSQGVPLKYSFWKNPTNTVFNYNAIKRLEMVKGDPALLYKEDGTLRELYLVFIRLNNFKGGATQTNIIQLAWKSGDSVGVNNISFASSYTSDSRDMSGEPIVEFDLFGNSNNGFGGIQLSCIIDTSLIPASLNGAANIGDSLQLDTLLFEEQLKAYQIGQTNIKPIFGGKKIVCFGDSVTEFGTYPEQIATITGATTYKIGFGGCRMGKRSGTSATVLAYDQLAMYRIAQSIEANDFTEMAAAIEYLKNNASDNNEAAFNRLISIDFATVDLVTIFFGTNDFTSNENPIGDVNSTDPMTMKGAINIVVNSLLTKYPNLRIAFITPTHRFWNGATWDDSDIVPNNLGLYLIDYCNAIIDQANYNHIPALDMYREGGFNKQNHEYYFGTDGVHPNSVGYTYLAQKFSAYLQTLFKY